MALVDPSWLPRIFLPYAGCWPTGAWSGIVPSQSSPVAWSRRRARRSPPTTWSLATGSSYPFPAKTDLVDTEQASSRSAPAHRALSQADRVLLLGAGPVGIELAGEIRAVWPDKSIVLLDERRDILGGPFMPELRAELRRQLEELDVEMVLGSPLREAPPPSPGSWAPSP